MALTSAINSAPLEALYNALATWVDSGVEDPKLFGSSKELPFFSDGVLYARLGMPIALLLPTSQTEVKTLFVTAVKLRVDADNPNTAYGDGQVRNILLSLAKARALPVFSCLNPEPYLWIGQLGGENTASDPELYANNLSAEWMGLVAQAIYFFRDSRETTNNFGQRKYDAERSLDCVRTLRWIKAKIDSNPEDPIVKITKEMIGYEKNEADINRLFDDLKNNFDSFLAELAEARSKRAQKEGEEEREIL